MSMRRAQWAFGRVVLAGALVLTVGCAPATDAFAPVPDTAPPGMMGEDGAVTRPPDATASPPDATLSRPDASVDSTPPQVDAAAPDGPCGAGAAVEPEPQIDGRWARVDAFVSRFVEPRGVTLYLPRDYAGGAGRYPVMYLHDGQNLFWGREAAFGVEWGVDETVDRLVGEGTIPALIVVGVHNTPARIAEYTPTLDPEYPGSGDVDAYGRFLGEELKPWVDARFRTRCQPAQTGLGGSSLGGLASFTLGADHPDVFRRIAAMSPSLWWDDGAAAAWVGPFVAGAEPDGRLWIDAGNREGQDADGDGRSPMVEGARAVVEALVDQGLPYGERLGYLEVPDGAHEEASWAARLGDVLTFLWAEAPFEGVAIELRTYRPAAQVGDRVPLAVDLIGVDGRRLTVPNGALEFESSDPAVARFDGPATLEVLTPGRTTVTAQYGRYLVARELLFAEAASTRITVTVPPLTPADDTVYLAGDVDALGNWRPDGLAMTRAGPNRWTAALDLPTGRAVEFKFTRGTWETVEKTENGGEVANRRLVADGAEHPYAVARWADD